MTSNNTINILCATDDKYVPYCGIMLTSLFENNKDSKILVYVIIDKPLSSSNENKFKQLAIMYNQQIEFVLINNEQLAKFPTKGMDYWSIAMYYRIFATELLPKTVNKLLYLDCDIIVNGRIKEVFNIDLQNKAIGCVSDIYIYTDESQKRLGYAQKEGYFNSGVLLINLDYWREYSVCQKCLTYLNQNYNRLFANDQDVLNAVLHDKKIDLPLTYNFQLQFLSNHFFNLQTKEMQEQIMKTINNPIIMHYAYSTKPWSIMYYKMPFSSLWKSYKHNSLWKYMLPTFPKGRKAFNWIIKRFILWPLGIMKYKSGFIELY